MALGGSCFNFWCFKAVFDKALFVKAKLQPLASKLNGAARALAKFDELTQKVLAFTGVANIVTIDDEQGVVLDCRELILLLCPTWFCGPGRRVQVFQIDRRIRRSSSTEDHGRFKRRSLLALVCPRPVGFRIDLFMFFLGER